MVTTAIIADGSVRVTVLRPTSVVDGTGDAREAFERVWARLPPFEEANSFCVLAHDGGLFLKGQRIQPRVRVESLLQSNRLLHETRYLGHMHDLGVPVPEILAHGVERCGGVPVRTFLLLRHVADSEDLRALVSRTTVGERRDVWEPVGNAVARLHAVGLFHRDLTARNVLVRPRGGEAAVHLIDCPRAEWGRLPLRRKFLRRSDLFRLGRSILAAGGTEGEVRTMLCAYGARDVEEVLTQLACARRERPTARMRAKVWVTLGV